MLLLNVCGLPAQVVLHPASYWQQLLEAPFDKKNTAGQVLWDSFSKYEPADRLAILDLLEKENIAGRSDEHQIKLNLLRARYCRAGWLLYQNKDWEYWGNTALNLATSADNDYLVQDCCLVLGDACLARNRFDAAVFYLLKSAELMEKLQFDKEVVAGHKISVSNALYNTQNYRQCVDYCRTDVDIEKVLSPITVITAYNNTGLSYLKLNEPDSAIHFFTKGVAFCKMIHWGIWEGILTGNIGDALYAKGNEAAALPYWQADYDTSMHYHETGNAGLTLSFISRYLFHTGERAKAIAQLHWCRETNQTDPSSLHRIYEIMADCYSKAGLADSAMWFMQRHTYLSDSINRLAAQSNYNAVQLRMNYEKNAHQFTILKKERQAEINKRNLLLVILLASVITGLLLLNRQRLKTKLLQQEKEMAELESQSAKEQLGIFTQTLLEKNEQIEALTASLGKQAAANTDELIHQSLLTDYDWNRFRELFEKTHPSFFANLKKAAPGITPAEMRLAALVKLNLDNKQMASMQGISVSSLRGNKTRLRQKLNIPADTELEELIRSF